MAEEPIGGGEQQQDSGAEDEQRPEQTVTVEDIGPARKCLTIEVPEQRIATKVQDSFSKLKDDASIPGFRQGRAPLRLIEKRFATGVRDDVRGELIQESFSQAIEDQKLQAIGEPDIKDLDDIKLPESGPMTFRVEIEVSPDVDLPDLDDIDVERPTIEVTDEKVEQHLQHLCDQLGKMVAAGDAKVEAGDYVLADVRVQAGQDAEDEAEVIEHHRGTLIRAGGGELGDKGQIVGILVEDLATHFVGKSKGEEVVISMTGPAAHENERIRSQPITIKVHINEVERHEPATIELLATYMGTETEQELRDQIRLTLESNRDRDQGIAMREQIKEYLLEKIEMDLPEQMSERQASRSLQQHMMEQMYRGVPEEEITQRLAEMREDHEQQSRRDLKLFFILEKAAKLLEIEVSQKEIHSQIVSMALQQRRRPEKLRQQMQRSGQLESLELQIRNQKVLDQILTKAKITDLATEEGGTKSKKQGTKSKKQGTKSKKQGTKSKKQETKSKKQETKSEK